VFAVITPVELSIEQPVPTSYVNVPSSELGEVEFEVTVALSPYFSEVLLYVDGFKVLVARFIVNVPLVTFAEGAV
jgi:hypothetical protein